MLNDLLGMAPASQRLGGFARGVVAMVILGQGAFAEVNLRPLEGALSAKDATSLGLPELRQKAKRCGQYFFVYPAHDQHGPLLFYVTSEKFTDGAAAAVLSERDEFQVYVEDRAVPAVELRDDSAGIEGHIIVLRLSKKHYQESKACLPKPVGATL